MTQVTDEMVAAASYAYEAGEDMRAALGAALAVRVSAKLSAERLRCTVTGNLVGTDTRMVGHPCACQTCVAADMIERQAEEIAELQSTIANREESVLYAKVDEMAAIVERLTTERAELIEALREMVDTQQSWEDSVSKIVGRPVLPFARAIDRACALLERLGAKEVE